MCVYSLIILYWFSTSAIAILFGFSLAVKSQRLSMKVLQLFLILSTPLLSSALLKKSPAAKLNLVQSIPRGGGGLLDADLAGKIFVHAFGANAALCGLFPQFAISKVYGVKQASATDCFLIRTAGAVGSNVAVLLYLQERGMSFQKAVGWSTLPYLAREFQSLLTNVNQAVGVPKSAHLPPTIMNMLVLYSSLTDKSWASSLTKFYGYFSILNAVVFYLAPQQGLAGHMVSIQNDLGKFLGRTIGYFLLGHGLAVLQQSTGWVALGTGIPLLGMALDGSFEAAGVPVAPAAVWIALLLVIGTSIIV